jgi:CBS domain-containing protein
MTPNPTVLSAGTSIAEAARVMRDQDIGAVVVETARGPAIATDRDIVVRGVAEGVDIDTIPVEAVCSREVTTIAPDTTIAVARALMQEKALRRLLVLEGDQPVGVLSIGDVAVDQNAGAVLDSISKAIPNR